MQQYLDLLRYVMDHGDDRVTRPDEGTAEARAVFAREMRFEMANGFPIITTKRMPFRTIAGELLWMISGSSDNADLHKLGIHIWDANANENSEWLVNPNRHGEDDLGRVYGVQWRKWLTADGEEIDQLAEVIERIKTNPVDRRLVVTAWNPGELSLMALPPCHMFFQFFVANGKLSLSMYQRSCDMFLGVPFNITSYALLLEMIAHVTGLETGEFVHILGDAHIYHDHFDAVRTQLRRKTRPLPRLWLNPDITNIDDFPRIVYEAIDAGESHKNAFGRVMRLEGYKSSSGIRARMPV